MTETLQGMTASTEAAVVPPDEYENDDAEQVAEAFARPSSEELDVARELVSSARERGVALTGPDGLLQALTKTVMETALDEEMSDHLGYDKHDPEGSELGQLAQRHAHQDRAPRHLRAGRDRGPSPT